MYKFVYIPIHICIGAMVRYPSLHSQIKSPGMFLQTPFPHTLSVVKLHSSISIIKQLNINNIFSKGKIAYL